MKTNRRKGLVLFVMMLILCNIYFGTTITAFAAEPELPEVDVGSTDVQEDSYCEQVAHTHTEKCYEEGMTQFVCDKDSHAHEDCISSECSVWNGVGNSIEVSKGENGYTFLSVYPTRAYEMSNHMVSTNGGEHNDIPQTLIIVEANEDYTWNADGIYSFGVSNYETLYCCDVETGYNDGIYYKRINLEDSSYYDEEDAAHIRSIITNSYPYVSIEEMKENLYQEGFEYAYDLNRAEIITAVQAAIWAYANEGSNYLYSRTFDVTTNPQWGTVAHDYTNQLDVWWETGTRKFSTDKIVEERINKLIDHLKQQTAVYADKNQIIISKLEVVDTIPVQGKDDFYNVVTQVKINNSGSSENDNLHLTVFRNGEVSVEKPIELGVEVYDLCIEAKNGDVIEVVVSGEQILPKGVYFYEPEGGRDVSQCLVGVAKGMTNVYEEELFVFEIEDTIDVDFILQKTDEQGRTLTGSKFELYVKGNDFDENEGGYTFDEVDINKEPIIFVGYYDVDENGQLILENMLPGCYSLLEIDAPEGYEKLVSAIQFEITSNGDIVLGENTEIEEFVHIEENVMCVKNQKEPDPDPEPNPEPDPDPDPEPNPEPNPEPDPDPDPDPEPNPEPDPDPDPDPEPNPEPNPDPKPDPDPEPNPEPNPDPDPDPDLKPEPEINTELTTVPDTGDNNGQIWVAFVLMMVSAVLLVVLNRKRKSI